MADDYQPTDGERALLTQFNGLVKRCDDDQKPARKETKLLRQYARNKQYTDAIDVIARSDEVRVNLILSILNTLIPLYYAKDPEIEVGPDEQVIDTDYGALKNFCKTLEIVLNRMFIRETRLKKRITRGIMSSMIGGLCWYKVSYQRNYREDPQIRGRLNDAQDNLARLEKLTGEVEEDPANEARMEELRLQVESLQQSLEVQVSHGLVIDFIPDEDVLILDESLVTFSDYPTAKMIAHRIWMTVDDYKQKFGHDPDGTKYTDKDGAKESVSRDSNRPMFVQVIEAWRLEDQLIYTWAYGGKRWAREPYSLPNQPRRWYPFFGLYWNEVDGELRPVSDVAQWVGLQDEYNAMRTQLRQAREENKPGFVINGGGNLSETDIRNLSNRQGRNNVVVQGVGGIVPLKDDMVPFPTFQIDPVAYDGTMVQRDLEQTSGASDSSRAAINKAKTATEAEIQAQGMNNRTSYRQDGVEETVGEMAEYAAELLLKELMPEDVQRIAGRGAVWPAGQMDDAFQLIRVRIRAGSTGKPNKNQERDAFVQMMPQLSALMDKVYQLRGMGAVQEADGYLELGRLMLQAFDMRIDLASFFPPPPPGMALPAPGMAPPAAHGPAGPMAPNPNAGPMAPNNPMGPAPMGPPMPQPMAMQ